jgi:hypothetical protein
MLEERGPRLLHGHLVDGRRVHHPVGRGELARDDEPVVRALDVLARDLGRHLLHAHAGAIALEVGLEVVIGFVQRHREAGPVVQLLQIRHVHLDDGDPGPLELFEGGLGDRPRVGIQVLEEERAIHAELHAAQGRGRRDGTSGDD